VRSIFSVGFCFGGALSYLFEAASGLGYSGVIGFYGWPLAEPLARPPRPIDAVSRYKCGVLSLFGGRPGNPPDRPSTSSTPRAARPASSTIDGLPGRAAQLLRSKQTEFAEARPTAWRASRHSSGRTPRGSGAPKGSLASGLGCSSFSVREVVDQSHVVVWAVASGGLYAARALAGRPVRVTCSTGANHHCFSPCSIRSRPLR